MCNTTYRAVHHFISRNGQTSVLTDDEVIEVLVTGFQLINSSLRIK